MGPSKQVGEAGNLQKALDKTIFVYYIVYMLKFFKEVFWPAQRGIWALFVGFASVLSWVGIGERWDTSTKTLIIIIVSLVVLFVPAMRSLYSRVSRPLSVCAVLTGTDYYEGEVILMLERSNLVDNGEVLTLVERKGEAEVPIGFISIEAITNKGYPQAVLIESFLSGKSLSGMSLAEYLKDASRRGRLQANHKITTKQLTQLSRRY